MSVHEFEIGSEFLGYRIEALIGRGGMGVVYRAFDLRLKRPVALKVVAPTVAADERFRARFEREAEILTSLEHPNVIPIYDAGDVEGRLYLAMRLVQGGDLGRLLRGGPLAPERAIAICSQIASALDAAHAHGLVHRDVKPSNVLLDGSDHVYLADFGLTRRREDDGELVDGGSIGTPSYLAPEQLEGGPAAAASDVYSLSCLLFECLVGQRVFPRESRLAVAWAHLEEDPPRASALGRQLPQAIDAVLARGLAKDPEERPGSCRALVEEAAGALGLRRRTVGGRALVVAAAAAVLLAVVATTAVALGVGRRGSPTMVGPVTGNSLVRIDPGANRIVRAVSVAQPPDAVAAAGGRVWLYSNVLGFVSEVDARTSKVIASTPLSVHPIDVRPVAGPYITADATGAWLAGAEKPGRSFVVHIRPGGHVRRYRLRRPPQAIALGRGYVWVLDHGGSQDRVLRLDPRTGRAIVTIALPASSRADSIAVGVGAVWVGSSSTATLFRVDPRSGRVADVDLGQTAGRPVIESGAVWVGLSDGSGTTVLVDPGTLAVNLNLGCCSLADDIRAFAYGSPWTYDTANGTVVRWNGTTYQIDHVFQVTDSPFYDGSCVTSLAVGGGSVWVTVTPSVDYVCRL